MADTYLDFIRQRRTFYSLTNTSPVSDERIVEVVREVVRHSPSSFNGQTSRVVILLREEHLKLWTIALEVLKSTFPAQSWDVYEKKLNDRKAAYGTVRRDF
jgi:predicted oxidoreductase (fatty acid repression mutant protein)